MARSASLTFNSLCLSLILRRQARRPWLAGQSVPKYLERANAVGTWAIYFGWIRGIVDEHKFVGDGESGQPSFVALAFGECDPKLRFPSLAVAQLATEPAQC